jgi:hypothetical protein
MKILVGGDVSFGRIYEGQRISYSAPLCLASIGELERDYCIFNLESLFCDDWKANKRDVDEKWGTSYTHANPEDVKHLIECGVDHVSLANNHTLDWGEVGVEQTCKVLNKFGISHSGCGSNDRTHIDKEKKIIVFSIDTVECHYKKEDPLNCKEDIKDFFKEVKELRAKHEDYLLICCVHWGRFRVSPNKGQKSMGRKLIDCGIDVVLGNHSHKVQYFEMYKGKPLFYSLGNLYFTHRNPEYNKPPNVHYAYLSTLNFEGRDFKGVDHHQTWCDDKKVVLKEEKPSNLGLEALRFARSYIGFGESEHTTNVGWFMKHIDAPNKETAAWCARFIFYCIKKACEENGIDPVLEKNDKTGYAKELYKQIAEIGYVSLNPMPGDIIVWDRKEEGNKNGHIGIIEYVEGDKITAIEGNRAPNPGSKVDRFTYSLNELLNYKEWDDEDKHFHLFEGFARLPHLKKLDE